MNSKHNRNVSSTQGKRAATLGIRREPFGQTMDGQAAEVFTLTNAGGASVRLSSYGATVLGLRVPDRKGTLGDVVLGFDDLRPYELQSAYFGATIGRVGNRIAQGRFKLDQVSYAVPINNGPNHLHGGFKGYDKRIWSADTAMTADGLSVRFTLVDPDGSEGYPGEVRVTVIYSFTDSNTLKIQYFATTSKPTPINLTNHTYFNLADGGRTDVLDHVMRVYGNQYLPVDATLIPTGQLLAVKGTPMDFTTAKPIGQDLKAMGGSPAGYDNTIVLGHKPGEFAKAAEVAEPTSGRTMEVWTTEPGVQFYSGNFLNGSLTGRGNTAYAQYSGFCLETQHFPDAVNHANFPSIILQPGEVYRQVTEYRFGVAAIKTT